MPFRTKETLEKWAAEFVSPGKPIEGVVDVLMHDGDPGEDTGLVVVRLRNATTEVHLEPTAPGSPTWHVIFGPRDTYFALGVAGLRELSEELAVAADLCAYLELRSLEALHALNQVPTAPDALPTV
ncbi:hypothetical protein ACEXQD_15870 [Herbiconiux sp. P15]|uniref:hypothetical protein n=1 Tax=Herbiconiux liukaitaii TaxID=3342799 RepID=UPI0035B8A07F